jgi:hypothetical protein
MIALRLVHLIEMHSEELAENLVHKVSSSHRSADIRKVPVAELRERALEIYRNLNEWLINKTEREIERVYEPLGARRAEQGVPLAALTWAILMTKENLWDFLEREGMYGGGAMEMFGELELLRHLGRFFDNAVYFATEGYEKAREQKAVVTA